MSLQISNLSVQAGETAILTSLSLTVPTGAMHALMGPNGSGKSTLASTLAGHPGYLVTGGTAHLDTTSLLDLPPEDRARAGLFLAFQYPAAIPGVSVAHFLRLARTSQEKAQGKPETALAPFYQELKSAMKQLHLPWSFAEREVNVDFSGGEKKRLEMLQMLILRPKVVILDEIDSGLDVDAMRFVADAVAALRAAQPDTSFLIITHYQRLLRHMQPDRVHIMVNGEIVASGDHELADVVEANGYQAYTSEPTHD